MARQGGLWGNANPSDPVWSIGWDQRSLRLKLLDNGQWHTYLLPKSSFNNDAIHGWYTPFIFPESFQAQWIRLRPDRNCIATAYLHQTDANYRDPREGRDLFAGLADLGQPVMSGSSLYALRRSRNLALSD